MADALPVRRALATGGSLALCRRLRAPAAAEEGGVSCALPSFMATQPLEKPHVFARMLRSPFWLAWSVVKQMVLCCLALAVFVQDKYPLAYLVVPLYFLSAAAMWEHDLEGL